MADIAFKSYCWSIGTTSYRTDKMNLSIERQLQLMNDFRNLPKNRGIEWRSLQEGYYRFLQTNDFVKGDATRPEKDAREKTSGLVNIGLLTKDRCLTESGIALLEICKSGNFKSNNFLEIASDSFLYLKQLLKTSICVGDKTVRPFIVLSYLLSKFGNLSKDEFTYFLPMCIDSESTSRVINYIEIYRQGKLDITTAIYDVISKMDNYIAALELFLKSKILTPELICKIGFNRKSAGTGKAYDTVFFGLYNILREIYLNEKDEAISLFNIVNKIKGNTKVLWKKLFFGKNVITTVKRDGISALNKNGFNQCTTEDSLRKEFFKVLHSYKVQATLKDYADLNKRYFKLSDSVLFRDNKVVFDIVPKALFNLVAKELYEDCFKASNSLGADISLYEINKSFASAEKSIYTELSKELSVSIENSSEAQKYVNDERYARFNALIDEKFSNAILVDLLCKFEERKDSEITSYITDNADLPTLFEYVLGVSWYTISERNGDILEYMNLSLDADLLPKTHAGGGMADIVYKYEECSDYPEHTLLIEATLSEKIGQRSMEIEPVTRHLGEYLANNDTEAYTLFIPTYLNPNIVTDFRMRKDYPYIANNGKDVDGMKIIPLQTSELKIIIRKSLVYRSLYSVFEKAHNSKAGVRDWYSKAIVGTI